MMIIGKVIMIYVHEKFIMTTMMMMMITLINLKSTPYIHFLCHANVSTFYNKIRTNTQ